MKIGDTVRFVSETGGGRVAGFQGKNIVLVEDEDGFQIPMQLKDVVVVTDEERGARYEVRGIHPNSQQPKANSQEPTAKSQQPAAPRKAMPEERRGGDLLSAYLAFVPMDDRSLSTTNFEMYFVNDCNYYMRFALFTVEGAAWKLRAEAEVEPNTKLFVEEFSCDVLNELERLAVQIIPYKRDKFFLYKSPLDVQLRIDLVKFYKLHTFEENDFFEQDALIYPIVENDRKK